jgi:hypothetical protein
MQKIIEIIIGGPVYATSTVILDPPNIPEVIGQVYTTAQPIFSSIAPWIWLAVGVLVAFAIVRFLLGLFS